MSNPFRDLSRADSYQELRDTCRRRSNRSFSIVLVIPTAMFELLVLSWFVFYLGLLGFWALVLVWGLTVVLGVLAFVWFWDRYKRYQLAAEFYREKWFKWQSRCRRRARHAI